jgi:hypothetical protein
LDIPVHLGSIENIMTEPEINAVTIPQTVKGKERKSCYSFSLLKIKKGKKEYFFIQLKYFITTLP